MAGAALIGFLAGSGLWLTAITLLILGSLFSRIIDGLAHLSFLYHQHHSKPSILHNLLIIIAWPTSIFTIIILLQHFKIIS
jgi:hypothetical protein